MQRTTLAFVLVTAGLVGRLQLGARALVAAGPSTAAAAQTTPVNHDAQVMAAFRERVDAYVALRNRLESTASPLPKAATPEQIDRHQRELAAKIAAARRSARQGDVIAPAMQRLVRTLIARVFARRDVRAALRESIEDENPRGIRVSVNGRYPENVPLTTMPPDVLGNLPKIPEDLEYRFVGDALILLDLHARLVVDLVPRALPARKR